MPITPVADPAGEAKREIQNLPPQQVSEEPAGGKAVLLDIREPEELALHGIIEGSVHAPRGMMEYYADPSTPYYRQEFKPGNRIILQCASGGRSALAASSLRKMGYENIAHLDGGIKAWKEAGLPVK